MSCAKTFQSKGQACKNISLRNSFGFFKRKQRIFLDEMGHPRGGFENQVREK